MRSTEEPHDPEAAILIQLRAYAERLASNIPDSESTLQVKGILTYHAFDGIPVSVLIQSVALGLHQLQNGASNYVAFDLLAIGEGHPCPETIGYYFRNPRTSFPKKD